jgi:hypothetical protein
VVVQPHWRWQRIGNPRASVNQQHHKRSMQGHTSSFVCL